MPDSNWVALIRELTGLLAAHGVFALVVIFVFYQQWRAKCNMRSATDAEEHRYFQKVHASVVVATYILIAISIPIWFYATFYFQRETIREGMITQLTNQPVHPSAATDPPLLIQQITPERPDVKFYYNFGQPSLQDAKYRLGWVLLSQPDVRNIVFYFHHRYEQIRAGQLRSPLGIAGSDGLLATGRTRDGRSNRDHDDFTKRFKLQLDKLNYEPGAPIQLLYKEDPEDPVRKVGKLHWINSEGELEPIPWGDEEPSADAAAEAEPSARLLSWFSSSAFAAQSDPYFQADGSYDLNLGRMLRQRLGSTDFISQMSARRILLQSGARSFKFIRDSLKAPADKSYDRQTLLYNLRGVVDEIETKGTTIPTDLHLVLARTLYGDGDYATAAQYFEKVSDPLADGDEFYFQKAYAYNASGQHDKAIKYYENFLDRVTDPRRRGIAYSNLGNVYLDSGRYEESLDRYRQAIEHLPPAATGNRAIAHTNLGLALYQLDRFAEAARQYEIALPLYGDADTRNKARTRSNLGDAYYRLDRLDAAARQYESASRLYPYFSAPHNNLAYMNALREVNLEQAIEQVDRALEIEPGNPNYLDTKGWVLYKMGRYQEALQLLEQAAKMIPEGQEAVRQVILDHLKLAAEAVRRPRERN
ncbi:MAG: tetratricopeptide repeat protein [Acidobacteriota bacterium]